MRLQSKGTKSAKIRANFILSPSKVSCPVSGAFGGNDGRGNIVAHLYYEFPAIPTAIEITASSTAPDEPAKQVPVFAPDAGKLTREVMGSFSMNPQVALSLGQWLIRHAEKIQNKTNTALLKNG